MKTIIFFSLLILAGVCNAQSTLPLRHTKGLYGLGVEIGSYNDRSPWYGVQFTKYLHPRLQFKSSLNYTDYPTARYSTQKVQLAVQTGYTLLKIKDAVFFNALLGGAGSYEQPVLKQEGGKDAKPLKEGFSYGALGGGEIEIYPISRLTLTLSYMQGYMWNSPVDQRRYMVGAGLRFNFW